LGGFKTLIQAGNDPFSRRNQSFETLHAYFRGQGFEVNASASPDLSHGPHRIEPAAVCERVSRHVGGAAEAVFIRGNGFRAAAAIEPLEAAIGRPVLTSNSNRRRLAESGRVLVAYKQTRVGPRWSSTD
jgi:maleate cis-trans isomerase